MLEWKEAAPLIGVIITGFLGIIGMFVAKMLQGQATAVAATAPAVMTATALAKEGSNQDLALAITGLTAVITSNFITAEKCRREREDDRDRLLREHHAEHLAEIRRIRLAIEEWPRHG